MKALINDITVEGTPEEIVEYQMRLKTKVVLDVTYEDLEEYLAQYPNLEVVEEPRIDLPTSAVTAETFKADAMRPSCKPRIADLVRDVKATAAGAPKPGRRYLPSENPHTPYFTGYDSLSKYINTEPIDMRNTDIQQVSGPPEMFETPPVVAGVDWANGDSTMMQVKTK